MRLLSLRARVKRLEELSRGLSREVLLWREGNDPLLYAERRAYLSAIQHALAGIEDARVILARHLSTKEISTKEHERTRNKK